MIKIEFTGPEIVRRIIGEVEWSTRAGMVQEVPAELAAEFLTSTDPDFRIAESDPFMGLKGITEDEITRSAGGWY